jgi:excisionase family DNA binding protein
MPTMFSEYPDVVSVDDLAKMLHIGKNKAYELVSTDVIQSIRVGKKHLIPKYRVIEFLTGSEK